MMPPPVRAAPNAVPASASRVAGRREPTTGGPWPRPAPDGAVGSRRPVACRPPAAPRRALNGLLRQELTGSSVLRFPRRELVYSRYGTNGGPAEDASLYIVESGYIKLVTPSRDGKECLLGIFAGGDVIGEISLGDSERYECAMTMTPAVVRRMPRAGLMAMLDSPGVREEFIRYLGQRLLEQQQLITDFVTADSEHRFAAILLHLSRKIGTRTGAMLAIDARITQEEFAAMVGTTRSRIGLFLKHFVEAGLVCKGGRGTIAVDDAAVKRYLELC
ncbi:cAMP-binding domain of CRP or a regulatory subunit of cAMP-dependent protein kinases [Jatrophihabitans endophyticus]|uniref:cAMP-binding domain of CRP or a regulatory subunit of cAMP-dependent protein kinases n=1 Tax=Jatrophihabitans endophyticus TaxID=1206085 RepID=A0A1M5I3T6_9ACTN|nr:Crp/Fnr family transcriptional regulator [Jatrophihabitans endophyticus]SHG22984.1 cAMP-binding domain of CRP or a regulatory subunit of cAMP-dependent protein kinases [Jatrophihabitans endophyticus]